ncbi:MAG: OsmC family protein [Sandaracinus sp.]|nr:OsmC family protein [Sandaracinus sp.]MCB9622725.1 OsmC family protein [Sandaracinus sp.]
MGKQVVEATVRGDASGLANTIRVREWSLVGDEPEAIGGTDTGPSPFEYLLSALGCCTSMTLALYAKRKGWPLEAVEVHLRHERVVGQSPLDRIGRVIELVGPLDDEQRARLIEIANKCPVHQALTKGSHVETSEAER